jgi:hypothetical protein
MNESDAHNTYAKALYDRRAEGVFPRLARVSIGEWRPLENECHWNTKVWCEQTQGYSLTTLTCYPMFISMPIQLFAIPMVN